MDTYIDILLGIVLTVSSTALIFGIGVAFYVMWRAVKDDLFNK